jgi:RHS repeat-associated protein
VTKTVEYYYDMFNRLTRRDIDADGAGLGVKLAEQFMHDGEEMILHGVPDTGGWRWFMRGPVQDMVLFEVRDGLRVFLGDHLNTIRDVVDTSGNIVNHLTIDSFGRRTAETNGNIEVMIGLSGRLYDEDTRLQNHVNRWYSVDTGRWLSEDPIGFGGADANLNRYVGNSPTNSSDPTGTFPVFEVAVTVFGFRIPLVRIDLTPPPVFAIPTKPNIPEGFWDSIGQSLDSIQTGAGAIGADIWGGDDDSYADQLYEEAYEKGPLGQTKDAPWYNDGVKFSLGLATVATAGAVAVGVSQIVLLGNQPTVIFGQPPIIVRPPWWTPKPVGPQVPAGRPVPPWIRPPLNPPRFNDPPLPPPFGPPYPPSFFSGL